MKTDDDEDICSCKYTKDVWLKMMSEIELHEADIHGILMNYFTVNGYQEVAEEFIKETDAQPEMPLASIGKRKTIQVAILGGDVEEAINNINLISSQILALNPEIKFLLRQQQLLQIIEKGNAKEAIEFAQQQLASCIRQNPYLLPQLEESMSLLAFSDLNCKAAQKLLSSMNQLEKTAEKIDDVILDYYNVNQDSTLEYLAKSVLFAQGQFQTNGEEGEAVTSRMPRLLNISIGAIEFSNGETENENTNCNGEVGRVIGIPVAPPIDPGAGGTNPNTRSSERTDDEDDDDDEPSRFAGSGIGGGAWSGTNVGTVSRQQRNARGGGAGRLLSSRGRAMSRSATTGATSIGSLGSHNIAGGCLLTSSISRTPDSPH